MRGICPRITSVTGLALLLSAMLGGCSGGGGSSTTTSIPPSGLAPGAPAAPAPMTTSLPIPSSVAEFAVPSTMQGGAGLTLGPDGNIWFTAAGLVGYIVPSWVPSHPVPELTVTPAAAQGIVPGQGQTLWFYSATPGAFSGQVLTYLVQISTSGTVLRTIPDFSGTQPNKCQNVSVLEPGSGATVLVGWSIAVVPEGPFAVNTVVQQINAAGNLVQLASIQGLISDLAQGPRSIWSTWMYYNFGTGLAPSGALPPAIAEITPTGQVNAITVPSGYTPGGITVCACGTPYVALNTVNANNGAIGRVNTDGSVTLFPVPSSIGGITTGGDGAIWFTEPATNQIGRLLSSGTITQYAIPTSNAGPNRIVAGPNNTMWFTEISANKIGRITY